MTTILKKYAELLVQYSVDLQAGELLLIEANTIAEPLVKEIYRAALRVGAMPQVIFNFEGQQRIFMQESNENQLQFVDPLKSLAFEHYDAYIYVRAPFNTREMQGVRLEEAARAAYDKARQGMRKMYATRTADRSLKRSLCEYPTPAMAQNARMSTEEYADFIYTACRLHEPDPAASWNALAARQQHVTDFLNQRTHIRYEGAGIDIEFSTKGRTWINSHGTTNMPSGEVYTSPVEDKVNGQIHFSYPGIYQGEEVEGVTLWVKDGLIHKWEAKQGQAFLDRIFSIKGARRFGEAAIGMNEQIQRLTRNILFDEKMGGTVHMAIGQSYAQAGGKNESTVHWDMITDMRKEGAIYADGEKIYEKGQFLI